MKILKNLLINQQQIIIPNWIVIAFIALAFIGFADSTYLTLEHYRGVIPPCTTDGCETVLSSDFSTILGFPISLLGSIHYLLIAIFAFLYFDTKKQIFFALPLFLSGIGFIFSLWLMFLQVFIIKAFCLYCIFSAIVSTLLFLSGCLVIFKNKDHVKKI